MQSSTYLGFSIIKILRTFFLSPLVFKLLSCSKNLIYICRNTQVIVDIVRSAKGLADIFFAIFPMAFIERVAQLTRKYCYDDWVVQRRKKDSDGNEMKQFYYIQVSPLTDGAPTPNRHHDGDNKQVHYSITSGFIITWIGILILQGAHFGSEKNKCGTRVTTNKCTDVRVSLGMELGSYCRMCYRKQLTTELSAKERRKTCRTSRMGCPICKESICKECWKEGYGKHA